MRFLFFSTFLSIAMMSPALAEEAAPTTEMVPAGWETLAAKVHDAFGKEDAGALSKALDEAAAVDLAKALVLASQNSLDPTVVAGGWRPTPENTEQAFRTTLAGPYSSYQHHLLLGIVHSWVKRDPDAARFVIDGLPESPERSDLQDNFRLALLRFRPEDALELALKERGAPGAIKVSEAAHALTKADRDIAIAALAKLPESDESGRVEVVRSITKHWSLSKPLAAADWAKSTLTSEPEKEVAYEEVVYTWSDSDADAAYDWALALDPGKARDSALRAYVFRTAHTNPSKAFDAGLAISDSHSLETALFTVILEWSPQNRAAAESAIDAATSLSEDLRGRLKTALEGESS